MMPLIIEAAARATVLALLAAAGLRLARISGAPLGPAGEKQAWTAVLAASLAMPLLMHILALATPPIAVPAALLQVALKSAAALPAAAYTHGLGFSQLSARIYLLIAAAALLRLAGSWLYVWRARRSAQVLEAPWTQGLDVRVSPRLSGPATFGSTILLPLTYVEWPAFKREAVLAHERAHVREHDAYLQWLAQLHVCLFWFSPLAWWLKRRLAALAEATADDAALQVLGDRPGYAQVLLELATPHHLRSTLSMSQRNHVAARIERILSETDSSRPRRRLMLFAAVLPAAVAAAALQLTALPAAHAQTAGTAEGPRIVGWADVNLRDYYPPKAVRKGIEGTVLLTVTLDREGHPTDAQVRQEEPADQGFRDAALNLSRNLTYSNPTGQPAQLTFHVWFSLKHAPAPGT